MISKGLRDAQLKSTAAQLYEKSYEKVHDFEGRSRSSK